MTGWRRRLLAGTVVAAMAFALPALAMDPRCEKDPDRPQCQSGEENPDPTTTTTVGHDPTTTTTTVGRDSTTTTLPPPTDDQFDAISVIGCSNTNDAVSGYLEASEVDRLVNTAWAGHTVEYWAVNDSGWVEHYLPLRPEDGFDGVWFNLCERVAAGLTQENAEAVLAKIWEIDPGIPVWVSPLNFYEGEGCDVTNGNQIPNDGAVIADALDAAYELVRRGPDLGPLTMVQLRRDLCHPSPDGITSLGTQLRAFFDG